MATCEGERAVGEIRGEGRCGGSERGEVVGRQPDGEPMRHECPRAVANPGALHRTLEPDLDLDRANGRLEEPRCLALEQPLEEPLHGGQGSHSGAESNRRS